MQCPHCRVSFHDLPELTILGRDTDGVWLIRRDHCPECQRYVFRLMRGIVLNQNSAGKPTGFTGPQKDWLVYPKTANRSSCPPEVPEPLANDYRESCMVLGDSAKASAALSRRCLQTLLREYAKVTRGNLSDEIQEVLDKKLLPSHLAEAIDAVRVIGNFAAHPIKTTSTGEIVDVEPGEADWNLDTLEGLFDFFFVQPAILRTKRQALNLKLKEAGKPPLK